MVDDSNSTVPVDPIRTHSTRKTAGDDTFFARAMGAFRENCLDHAEEHYSQPIHLQKITHGYSHKEDFRKGLEKIYK